MRRRRCAEWILGCGIETSLGQSIYGTNTKLQGLKPAEVIGEKVLRFRLPEVWLGEGSCRARCDRA